jgi:uncharacterized membrane protein YgdD (TMEM256/DUF423 family)
LTSFSIAGWGFFVGIILFSGSLYLLATTSINWLGAITYWGDCISFWLVLAGGFDL